MSNDEIIIVRETPPGVEKQVNEIVIERGAGQGLPGAAGEAPTAQNIGDVIAAAESKTTLVDADGIGVSNSEDGDILVEWTYANLKAQLTTLFNLIYQPLSSALNKITESGGLPRWDGGAWPSGEDGAEWINIGSPVVASGSPFVTYQGLDNSFRDYRIRSEDVIAGDQTGQLFMQYEIGGSWVTTNFYYSSFHVLVTFDTFRRGNNTGIRMTDNMPVLNSNGTVLEITIHNPSASAEVTTCFLVDFINSTIRAHFFGSGNHSATPGPVTGVRLYQANGTVNTLFGKFQLQGRGAL